MQAQNCNDCTQTLWSSAHKNQCINLSSSCLQKWKFWISFAEHEQINVAVSVSRVFASKLCTYMYGWTVCSPSFCPDTRVRCCNIACHKCKRNEMGKKQEPWNWWSLIAATKKGKKKQHVWPKVWLDAQGPWGKPHLIPLKNKMVLFSERVLTFPLRTLWNDRPASEEHMYEPSAFASRELQSQQKCSQRTQAADSFHPMLCHPVSKVCCHFVSNNHPV